MENNLTCRACAPADQHAQIINGPKNQAAVSGDTAMFNCTFVCGNKAPVTWYITLPTSFRAVSVSSYTPLNQIKSIYGIEVSRGSTDECSQGGYHVEHFYVKAVKQLNLMPVQCSTLCLAGGGCGCGTTQVYFSMAALLSVTG